MFDIVSVGHFSLDSIFLPERTTPFNVLGGSVAYVSFAVRRLDSRVAVVSNVGSNFLTAHLWWLGQEGIDLSGVSKAANAQTTRFELKYNGGLFDRVLQLKNRSPY